MKLEDIDLLDLDRFMRREHDEMFTLLRKEAPIFWTDETDGGGFLVAGQARRPSGGQPQR